MENKIAGARFKVRLRLMLDDEIAFGPGKADLLDAIHATGSIAAAGKQLGMSYRRAWLLVDSMNRCFLRPLVETSTGGSRGGGARVTDQGLDVLKRYRQLQVNVQQLTGEYFPELKPLLRKKPITPL